MKPPNLPTSFIDLFLCLFIVFQVLNVVTPDKKYPINHFIISFSTHDINFTREKINIELKVEGQKFLSKSDSKEVKWHFDSNQIEAILNYDLQPANIEVRIDLLDDELSLLGKDKIEISAKTKWDNNKTIIGLTRDKYFKSSQFELL